MDRNFFYAIAVLIGTIVGAGIFGIPYVVAQSGFLIGTIFLISLTVAILLIHLIYGEIVCRTEKKCRLVGYAEHYLGKSGKKVATVSMLISLYGALLVYIIIGGEFFSVVLSPLFGGSVFTYSLIFLIICALAIFKDLILIKPLEFLMTVFLIFIIFIIFFAGLPYLNINNLKIINLNLKSLFLPYGVIFWALAGGSAIPEIKEALSNKGKFYKKVIVLGTLIPAVLYFLFMLVVVGTTGTATSPEAIQGLSGFLGKWVIILGAIFGILAVMTSFFVLGLNLKKIFWYDYKINKTVSWFLVCLIPLFGFFLGLRGFIPIISFLGVILGAVEGTLIILIYKKAKKFGNRIPEYSLKIPNIIIYFLIGIFILGLIYQIIYFIK